MAPLWRGQRFQGDEGRERPKEHELQPGASIIGSTYPEQERPSAGDSRPHLGVRMSPFLMLALACNDAASSGSPDDDILRADLGNALARIEALEQADTVQLERISELEARVAALEEEVAALGARVDAHDDDASALVVSRYEVDCARQVLYDAVIAEYDAAMASGSSLDGMEGFYATCILVRDVEPDALPLVLVAQDAAAVPDWLGSTNVWSNSAYVWYDAYSGGYMYGGGVNTFQLAPGMQVRYDRTRRILYTAADWRGERAPNAPYQVVVVGDRSFGAP